MLDQLLRLPRAVLEWAPVWAPVAVCVQIAVLGLRPALQEQRRLAHEEVRLEAQHAELLSERARLDRELEAQHDVLYVERERRALRDPASSLR